MDQKLPHEILGVGNPMLDHLLKVDDQYLNLISGQKYGMESVSYPEIIQLIEKSGSIPKLVAGGSCANAIKGLAALGRKCALTGKIGTDASGEKVLLDLQDMGVTPLMHFSSRKTAHVVSLITPDGRRTLRTFLGAAEKLTPNDLVPSHFDGTKLVHIEGYTLLYPGLTKKAMMLAKERGARVSLDFGSFELVNRYKLNLKNLLSEFVDITFANEMEILSFTGEKPEKGCKILQKFSPIAVSMMGSKGCFVADNSKILHFPAYPVNPIDTTGAGDLFASGFLHGFLAEKSLQECARWGALTAQAVVQEIGAEIPQEKWEEIKKKLG